MDVFEAIETRRSVKYYEPEHRLTEEELRRLVSAAMLAPSSFNIQNWQFVVCTDREVQTALCDASWNQVQVRDCAATIIIAGDLEAHNRHDRFLRFAPEQVRTMFEGFVSGIYEGKATMLRDEACRSVGLAGMNLMLAARAMGYDSCPMIGYDPAKVTALLGLPDHCPPLLMLAIGAAKEPARPRLGLLDYHEVLSCETYDNRVLEGEIPHE